MAKKLDAYRGCLLGLAAGDAMGCAVDSKNWEEITRDYGPSGLLGYDLVNGFADITSHTQVAAFCANGLLVGLTHGQLTGRMAPFVRYITLALNEWSKATMYAYRVPDKVNCWVSRVQDMRRRRCVDSRMLDTLHQGRLGTPEEVKNRNDTPGALTTAVPVGLFFNEKRMKPHELGRLGVEAVALTHGDPTTFLCGAVIAYAIAGTVADEDTPLQEHFLQAAEAVAAQFGRVYPQAENLKNQLLAAMALVDDHSLSRQAAMEKMSCRSAVQVLGAAMYACLASLGDFDTAMIIAVNHSGRSSAVGALTGAFLGAKLGQQELPEFYTECLESAGVLSELAEDMALGCPMGRGSRLFDDTWDQKYTQGQQVDPAGWAVE